MDGGAPPHGRISTREHALEWLKIWSAPCVHTCGSAPCVHTCGQCGENISTQKSGRGNSNTLEDLQLARARRRKEWEANRWEWGVCMRKRAFMCCFACASKHVLDCCVLVVLVDPKTGVAISHCEADHSLPLAYRMWSLEKRRALFERCHHCSVVQVPWEPRHDHFFPCHRTLFPEFVKGCCMAQTMWNVVDAWSTCRDWELSIGNGASPGMSWQDFSLQVNKVAASLSLLFDRGTLLRIRWSPELNTASLLVNYCAALVASMGVVMVSDDGVIVDNVVDFPADLSSPARVSHSNRHVCNDGASTCLVLSTSGSTGRARPVSLTFDEVHHQLLASIAPRVASGRTCFVTLTDFRNSIFSLAGGVGAMFCRRDTWVADVCAARPSYLVTTPALLELLDESMLDPDCEITVGGAPVSDALKKRFTSMAPRRKFSILYGTTETGVIACNNVVLPGVIWELREETGGVGQFWVKTQRRGWIDTGDMVERISSKRIRVVGRHHASFKTNLGVFFNPEPLEALLQSRHADVVRSVFIFEGFRAVFFVHIGKGPDHVALALKDSMAFLPSQPIEYVCITKAPPVNATGKVTRSDVWHQYRERLEPQIQRQHKKGDSSGAIFGAYQPDVPLSDQVNSLSAAALVVRIQKELGIQSNAGWLLSGLTPNEIMSFLLRELCGSSGERIVRPQEPPAVQEELDILSAMIRMTPRAAAAATLQPPILVFVTGASGFLGRHVTAWCLAQNLKVAILVRKTLAMDNAVLQFVGDVAMPYFGLELSVWLELAASVTHIVHCAARVDALLPYRELRGPNVVGTMEVLRLRYASCHGVRMVHVSSAAVFNAYKTPSGGFPASFPLDASPSRLAWEYGYSQSKWMAEHLVRQIESDAVIVRPGIISHCSVTGDANLRDFDARFVMTCLDLGVVPDSHGPLASTPVNVLAAIIGEALLRPAMCGVKGCININVQSAPSPGEDDLSVLIGALELHRVPYTEWLHLVSQSPHVPLAPLLDMFGARAFPIRSGGSMQSSCEILRPPGYWELLARYCVIDKARLN